MELMREHPDKIQTDVNKFRDPTFDIAKGIGMLFVVIGHVGMMHRLSAIAYSFHMPLFFIISGYFFKPKNTKELAKKRFERLIIPYVVTCLFLIIIAGIIGFFHHTGILNGVTTYIKAALFGNAAQSTWMIGIQQIGPIWFLPAMFIAELIYNIICDKKGCSFWVLLCFCLGFYSSKRWLWALSIQPALCAILFIHIGYLCKKYHLFNQFSIWSFLAALIIWKLSKGNLLIKTFDLGQNIYTNPAANIICALAGAYMVICFSKWLAKFDNSIIRLLLLWGQCSLIFLCFHTVDMDFFQYYNIFKILPVNAVNIQNYIVVFMKVAWATAGIVVYKWLKTIFNNKTVKLNS